MGKKGRTKRVKPKPVLPESPPPPIEEDIGSLKLLQECEKKQSAKCLDRDGYDDDGKGDLMLLLDLEDHVMRRQRGEIEYFTAYQADKVPRDRHGDYARFNRHEQKMKLAKILYKEDQEAGVKEDEVYVDTSGALEDSKVKESRQKRLDEARVALKLAIELVEPSTWCLTLIALCKRRLALFGKEGATAALRCIDKAIEIAGDGLYDSDDVLIEVRIQHRALGF